MFSSLLSRPKNSSYEPPTHVIPNLKQSSSKSNSSKALTITSIPQVNSIITKEQHPGQQKTTTAYIQSNYEDTIPLKKRYPNLIHHFPRPDRDSLVLPLSPEEESMIYETKLIVDKLIASKLGMAEPESDVNYVKVTNSSVNDDENEKIIQVKKFQTDPMLPPKFKLRKNRHEPPPPPPPILKKAGDGGGEGGSKLTKSDREKWNIPAAISNWKNNQGFTISLEKRMISQQGEDGEGSSVNVEKFGELSQALADADVQAREEIRIRNEIRQRQAIEEQERRQEKLKRLTSGRRGPGPKRRKY
ncbi:PRP45 [[Candida] subhashii]|uniref:Pre-mRNA-processing protein 45 n=1 Tax=[Candida] subhashii TaxID=561895 RepID=A0A8J5QKH4_9ASCO|nr:PRP45 [[Candida] subhashii]KAG7666381.1 PRP45 [[Candida] subhashii]